MSEYRVVAVPLRKIYDIMMDLVRKQARAFRVQMRSWWIAYFWTKPDSLWALKVTLAIALMVIPACIAGEPFAGMTLALGAVGASLAENDDHPRGRVKTFGITMVSFLVVAFSVELLRPYPLIFIIGFALTTLALTMIGGLRPSYQGISFAALLVSIYAMLGAGIKPWYYQSVLLPLGGGIYGAISIVLLYARPFRLLQEQLATAYKSLATYIDMKSRLFPSTWEVQKSIRTDLAQQNIAIERSIEGVKQVLFACAYEMTHSGQSLEKLEPYYNKWLLLQQLHERTVASHQRYDILAISSVRSSKDRLLVEGFGRMLHEIAFALRRYADSLLTGEPYVYPIGLKWTISSMQTLLANNKEATEYAAMSLLFDNLRSVGKMLNDVEHVYGHMPIETLEFQPPSWQSRLRTLFDVRQARFRHAIRLIVCFVLGYGLVQFFDLTKGEWIVLTSLFVCQQSYTATRQRLGERILGTVVGVIAGVCLAGMMPTMSGQIVLLLVSIFLFFYWARKKYYVAVIFITMFVIAAFNIQTGIGVQLMEHRLLHTFIGAFLAFLVVRFIWPDWQYRHLPELMRSAILQNKIYFDTICAEDLRGHIYYRARRAAHQADNAIATAWRGMFVEPKSKRFLQKKAYDLTYQNHCLLSYISALGAHHYGKPLSEEQQSICKRISTTLEACIRQLESEEICGELTFSREDIRRWEAELWREKAEGTDSLMVLLYNIAHSADELLKETLEWKSSRKNKA